MPETDTKRRLTTNQKVVRGGFVRTVLTPETGDGFVRLSPHPHAYVPAEECELISYPILELYNLPDGAVYPRYIEQALAIALSCAMQEGVKFPDEVETWTHKQIDSPVMPRNFSELEKIILRATRRFTR